MKVAFSVAVVLVAAGVALLLRRDAKPDTRAAPTAEIAPGAAVPAAGPRARDRDRAAAAARAMAVLRELPRPTPTPAPAAPASASEFVLTPEEHAATDGSVQTQRRAWLELLAGYRAGQLARADVVRGMDLADEEVARAMRAALTDERWRLWAAERPELKRAFLAIVDGRDPEIE